MGDLDDRLRDQQHLLEQLADALPLGVVRFDARYRVTFANPRLQAMTGTAGASTLEELFAAVAETDRGALEAALLDVLADEPVVDFDITLEGAETPVVCSVAVRTLTDRAGTVTGGIACVSDITHSVPRERLVQKSATTDPLTGCLNRSATWEVLADLLRAENVGQGVAVIFVDLDGFTEINQTLGHEAGDRVLEETARRLMSSIREGDHIGRVGGDEFLLICRNVSSRARARTLARRFGRALNGTMQTWDEVITLQGSVGVTWTSQPVSAEYLVARADQAMRTRRAAREAMQVVQFPNQDDGPIPRQGGAA